MISWLRLVGRLGWVDADWGKLADVGGPAGLGLQPYDSLSCYISDAMGHMKSLTGFVGALHLASF